MKMKFFPVLLALCLLPAFSACSTRKESFSADLQPTDSAPTEETATTSRYAIRADSTIASDFSCLGLAEKAGPDALALSGLYCMFPDDEVTYLYFSMPCDTQQAAYRVSSVEINGYTYDTTELQTDGYYQKYSIENLRADSDGAYNFTEIHYFNKADANDVQTYNINRLAAVSFDDNLFSFEQTYYYNVTLQGQCFESVYQFNKDNNVFVDMWAHVIGDADLADGDTRSFFYFAFNCYDTERKCKFFPDDITALTVMYTENSYQYKGKNRSEAENITPQTRQCTQHIIPENRQILAKDDKRSNKRLYEYRTINDLQQADTAQIAKAANGATLQEAQRQYTWAVQIGNCSGYPCKETDVGVSVLRNFDIDYTRLSDIQSIDVTYTVEGHKLKVKTESLVKDSTTTVEEPKRKATNTEKEKYESAANWQDPDKSTFEKAAWQVKTELKPHLVPLVCAILFSLALLFICWRIKNSTRFLSLWTRLKDLFK